MQLIDRNKINFELRIESLDDLWILSQFIVVNDRIFGTTERKVKIGTGDNVKTIRKLIFVEINVKSAIFENEQLKISGKILNETQFTAIGQAHSINFVINDKIKIEKKNLLKFEEKMLSSAINSKKSKNLLVLMDKDELIAVEFSEFNYSVLFEKKNLGSKKYILTQIDEEEEKFKILEQFLKKDYSNIIFAGTGLWKNKLSKFVKDKIGLKIQTFSFADVSTSSISRVLKDIYKMGILQNSQLAKEENIISKLLENINKNEKYIYGEKNTTFAINEGKIEILLISTKFIDTKKEEEKYIEINELMRLVEKLNGELVIINSKNESGKVLDGLGGIGGILRY